MIHGSDRRAFSAASSRAACVVPPLFPGCIMSRPLMTVGFVRPFVVLFARDFVLNHAIWKPCHKRSFLSWPDLAWINAQKLVQGGAFFSFCASFLEGALFFVCIAVRRAGRRPAGGMRRERDSDHPDQALYIYKRVCLPARRASHFAP